MSLRQSFSWMQGRALRVLFSGCVYRAANTMTGDQSDQPTDNARLHRHSINNDAGSAWKTLVRIRWNAVSATWERLMKTMIAKSDMGVGTTHGGMHAVTRCDLIRRDTPS